jgi:hypothetical protein
MEEEYGTRILVNKIVMEDVNLEDLDKTNNTQMSDML